MTRRVYLVESVSQHAHRLVSVLQSGAMGVDIHTVSQSANYQHLRAKSLQVSHETAYHVFAV